MRRHRWRSTTAIIIVAALVGGAGAYRWLRSAYHGARDADRTLRLLRAPMAVAPGVFMLGGLSPSAAYVIETSEGLVLVDSGLDRDAAQVKSHMAALGLDWKRIRAILLTHAHGDHTGGAEHLRQATTAPVYAGAGDASVLRAGGPREAFFSTFDMPGQELHSTTVDVVLKGGETITVGDVEVQAVALPGHTPGSIGYLLTKAGRRVLFSGDVIMMLRGDEPPRSELGKPLGTYSAYLAPRYRGNAQDSLATLRRLRALPVPDLLLPGHPGADVNPESPQLTQTRWEALLDQGIRDLETLVARYQQDGADFLDGNPRQILPGLDYLGDFHGQAVYGFSAATRFFLVDAPGGPGLAEFVSARLRKLGREPAVPSAVLLTACGPDETAGLRELIEKHHTEVVAAYEGIERLKDLCPAGTTFLAAEDLADQHWFPVKLVSLRGRASSPIGYLLTWTGKTVLFSGRIPLKLDAKERENLTADLTRDRNDLRDYFTSLTRLRGLKIDVWLPAIAVHCQNAHLYDGDWEQVLDENLAVVNFVVKSLLNRQSLSDGPTARPL